MMLSSPYLNSRCPLKISNCCTKAVLPRAESCSSTSLNGAGAVSSRQQQQNLIDSFPYKIDVTNGSSLSSSSSSSSCLPLKNAEILDAVEDEYEGVLIKPESLPINHKAFVCALRSSISQWKSKGKKGVWLKLPIERSDLVPIAVKEGFEYHHAERSHVMLTYWIPDTPSLLPSNASHQVGIGAFVINDRNEVLVVRERHCNESLVGLWKIPTGFIHEMSTWDVEMARIDAISTGGAISTDAHIKCSHKSEEIYAGAVREVKEETGIDAEFVEVVAFRHAQNVSFEKSDLFFVCMLRSITSDIALDDLEIEDAKWMALEEFVKQPLIESDSMFKKITDICIARLGKLYCGLSVHRMASKFDGQLSSLYFNEDHRHDDDHSTCQAS